MMKYLQKIGKSLMLPVFCMVSDTGSIQVDGEQTI